MYTAALSCELSITTTHLREGRYAQDIHEFRRFIFYNVLIICTACVVSITAHAYQEIESDDVLNTTRCHYSRGDMELYGVGLPTALSIIVVIIANFYSWCNILKMMQVFMPDTEPNAVRLTPQTQTQEGSKSETLKTSLVDKFGLSESNMTTVEMLHMCYDTFMRLDSYTARTVIRLMATPLIYVTIYTMGLIIMLSDPQAGTSILVTLCGVLLLPPVNTCLWIITDVPVMTRHRNWILHCQYTNQVHRHGNNGATGTGTGGGDGTDSHSDMDSDRESDVEQLYATQYQRTYSDILRNPMTIFGGTAGRADRSLSDTSNI